MIAYEHAITFVEEEQAPEAPAIGGGGWRLVSVVASTSPGSNYRVRCYWERAFEVPLATLQAREDGADE